MARPLRIQYEDAAYHIISRGNARAVERYHWICRACCLMPNHYHLQGRYKAILVEKDGRSWSGISRPGGGAVTGPPPAMKNPRLFDHVLSRFHRDRAFKMEIPERDSQKDGGGQGK